VRTEERSRRITAREWRFEAGKSRLRTVLGLLTANLADEDFGDFFLTREDIAESHAFEFQAAAKAAAFLI
jgi:hypothetical protein